MNNTIPTDYQKEILNQVSNDATAYWKSQTLYTAVKLEIFDVIESGYNTIELVSSKLQMKDNLIAILLKGLLHLQYLSFNGTSFTLTERSTLLTKNNSFSLTDVVKVWGSEHYNTWQMLDQAIGMDQEQFSYLYKSPFFTWINSNKQKKEEYYSAMHTYALKDYSSVINQVQFTDNSTIIDIGGGLGTLSLLLSKNFQNCSFNIFDLPETTQFAKAFHNEEGLKNVTFIEGDFFKNEIPKADYYLLARVLHDWNDEQAIEILCTIKKSLDSKSEVLIFEHPISDDLNDSWGSLLDLNMKVITGGSERTLESYKNIISKAGLSISEIKEDLVTGINIIKCKKNK